MAQQQKLKFLRTLTLSLFIFHTTVHTRITCSGYLLFYQNLRH